MNKFEKFLISKCFDMYILDCKDMKYKKPIRHNLSTMTNIDHRYIQYNDENFISKINQNKSVMNKDFTFEDRKNEIIFGLHEVGKPSILISPRPRIKLFKDGIILTEQNDDAMNIVLEKIDFEHILKAMFDESICIEIEF